MLKNKLSTIKLLSQQLHRVSTQIDLTQSTYRHFSLRPRQQQNNQNQNKSNNLFLLSSISAGLLALTLWDQSRKHSHAEEEIPKLRPKQPQVQQEQQLQQPKPFLKKKLDETLSIPLLLQQREQQKQKEYQEREIEDINEIERGLTEDDLKTMHELDKMIGATPSSKPKGHEEEKFEEYLMQEDDNDDYIKDPYVKSKANLMKHQEYRTIKVGPTDLLKNGQMIQVAVCDPFDETKYHPTDKVIIAKHNDLYHAVGSFCGFDYTNLATGVFLGDKLICPSCGSTYNITNGFVDQGPSLRSISSFLIQQRENKVQLIMPEHVPAFQKKQFIKRQNIDPRTFVILGDSETALSAIDALRASFTGRIVVVPSSPYGQFENTDILNKKFTPIQKNEVYMVEEDYLDRANIDVVKGEIKTIDLNRNEIVVKGVKEPIAFDKVMVAWGSYKKRLNKEYSNVFYLEDRHSHARCHNELLKAKSIVIMGGTFEAYQTAASIREYLDSINYTDVQIMLIDPESSEIQKSFGLQISNEIHEMLRSMRISVMMKTEISKIQGLNKIEAIYFKNDANGKSERNVEYFVRPDVVIAENGIGQPKYDLKSILAPATNAEAGEPPIQLGIDPQGIPASDVKFSLHYNDLFSPILAAGSCTLFPSFLHKIKVRTTDMKYNIEAGFFAAMSMMDKRVEFRYFPFSSLKIGTTPIYFVGERCSPFHEVIINGSVEEKKFVAYFVYGNEVTGLMTCGYQNLHLYLWEAFKLLIMPPATQLRNRTMDYKSIVQKVLAMRPLINCKRHDIVKIPSVILAEFDNELQKSENLRMAVKKNIESENRRQKEKFMKMKEKYDRDGVEFIQDEIELAERREQGGGGGGQMDDTRRERAHTAGGSRKPGVASTGAELQMRTPSPNVNMGTDNDNQKNPLSMIINVAKKTFNG